MSYPAANACIPASERRRANLRLLASQTPNHDPEHQPLPPFAAEWIARYDRGDDVSNWFSSKGGAESDPSESIGRRAGTEL